MKDSRIEVIFSEKEFKFFEQYSKKYRLQINDVIRSNLEQWLNDWEMNDSHVSPHEGPVIIRGRKDSKRYSITLTAVGSEGADWFNGQITDEPLSDDEMIELGLQPNQ
jgi:hypothetical protein